MIFVVLSSTEDYREDYGDSYLSQGNVSPKVNVIAWLEFELAYSDVAVAPIVQL